MACYKCVIPMWLQEYDDDGFAVENAYKGIDVGEVWAVEKQKYNIVAANDAIHLVRNNAWIEIHQNALDVHFKPVQARVYDFDPSWDVADGEDKRGEYVLRDVDYISDDGTAVLCMGARSHTYELDTTGETKNGD